MKLAAAPLNNRAGLFRQTEPPLRPVAPYCDRSFLLIEESAYSASRYQGFVIPRRCNTKRSHLSTLTLQIGHPSTSWH